MEKSENKQADDAENGVVAPVKKKIKISIDNSSSSHATFTRRLGDCVPLYWRDEKYTECEYLRYIFIIDNPLVVKFCIRKSVDLTMSLKADRNDIEGTQNKYRAIENVILENGNAKTAAINYGVFSRLLYI